MKALIAMPVELDNLLERARVAVEGDGWTVVDVPEDHSLDLVLSRLELSRDVALLRSQYEFDLPLDLGLKLAQPEVYFDPRRPANEHQVACGIEKINSPGDAIVWNQIRITPFMLRTASVLGTPLAGALSLATLRFRMVVQRDFPHDGKITVVCAPLHPGANDMLEEWGMVHATVAVLEGHEDPRKTRVVEVKQLTRVPIWAVPMAAPMQFKHQLKMISEYVASDAYRESAGTNGNYIVVGIRRCAKGPPLLPRDSCSATDMSSSTEWVEAESGGVRFGFPEYLRSFLEKLDVNDIDIYDRLHGRQVVRYQAVVQQSAWDRAWVLLEIPFKAQRTAYRRLHSGSVAPDISVGMQPKFVTPEDSADHTFERDDETRMVIPTARTFIHLSNHTTRPPVGSEPAYIDLNLTMPTNIE